MNTKTMQVNREKLEVVLHHLGSSVHGCYCSSAVTIGEVDGVVYRLLAMNAAMAEEMGYRDVPGWAACFTPEEKGESKC